MFLKKLLILFFIVPLLCTVFINFEYCTFKGFLAAGEIDPLNRRFSTVPKPDVVVQGKRVGS